MKKVRLILCAVMITAMMVTSCGEGTSVKTSSSNEESTSNEKLSYNEVTIGKQVWMTENLNVDKFRNGDLIPEVKTHVEWEKAGENKQPAWCYYNNEPNNGKIYGKLYNWYAVNDTRGLAPKGWHIPSEKEWVYLYDYLGGQITASNKLKSTNGWNDNGYATNESGFSGLPGGARSPEGKFYNIGDISYWWSSSEGRWGQAIYRDLGFSDVGIDYIMFKESGLSVRCIKD